MRRALFLIVAGISVCSCGGSGVFGSNADANLDATPNPAPYGVPVNITWGGSKLLNVVSSNFGVQTSQTSGSITDNPGVDTTYNLTVTAQNDGHDPIQISKSLTVSVVKSTKSVLVIGDASVSGPNQVMDSVRSLTTGSVTISPSLPASTVADLVVLHPSASLSTADRSSLDSLFTSGKGVLFIGSSVSAISGGNVASIGGYLGGATSFGSDIDVTYRSTSGFIPVSSRYRGVRLTGDIFHSFTGLVGVGTSADRLIGAGTITSALAYKIPSGGRAGFVEEDGVGSGSESLGFNLALRTIARWCMDGA